MHYSQMKMQQSSSRKNAHPGTPRPNPENFKHEEQYFHSSSSSRWDSSTSAYENQGKNFMHPAKPTNDRKGKSCDLSKNEPPCISSSNSSESLPDYFVWVKNEPFEFGVVPPFPCPKIGINILRKIADYCREKPGHFPELSLNQWSHICKYKMQLATDLCFTYFRVFDVLTRSHLHAQNNSHEIQDFSDDGGESWDMKFHKAVKQGHDFDEDFKVDTTQFLLFLYLQHFLRLHKKYTMKSYEDEPWPKAWGNNLIGGSAGSGANIPEQQQAEFVMANLSDIIDFLMLLHATNKPAKEADGKSSKEKVESQSTPVDLMQSQRIHIDVLRALSFILGAASTTPNTEFKTLDECLLLANIRWKLEYSRYSRTVDKRCFLQWIMKNLKINPWGPSSVSFLQQPLSVMAGVWDDVEYFKQNKIFWNTQSFPKSWYLISGVEKQVIVIDALEPMTSIKIHRCVNAFIYLPGVYNFISVQKCHGITLNIGVTLKIVKFIDCSGITVSGVGRQFIISDVSSSTFHLLTPSSPIVCGSKNHKIYLAPYNTTYPTLASHMKIAGIPPKIQRWNRPVEIANDGLPRCYQQSNVLPLPPEQFKVFHFPFRVIGSSSSTNTCISNANTSNSNILPLSGILPSSYQRRVDFATEKMEEARKVFALKLMHSEEDTSLIYQITLHRFKKWLKESGHFEHIVGLRSYQKSLDQERSHPIVCTRGHDLACVSRAMKNFFKEDFDIDNSVRSSPPTSSHQSPHDIKHQAKNVVPERKGSLGLVSEKHAKRVSKGAGSENKDYGSSKRPSNVPSSSTMLRK